MRTLQLVQVNSELAFWAACEKETRWLYEEIFQHGCYDDIRLPEGAFVLDVGANIGMFTYFIKRRCPSARILAFEPMPESIRALRENIAAHGLDQVVVEEFGLGSTYEEEVEFTYYPVQPGNSTRYPEEKQLQKTVLLDLEPPDEVELEHIGYPVTAAIRPIADYLPADRHVDLLKVDVEGAELDVMRGIRPEQWPLIDQVMLEVQDLDGRLQAICDLLREHGLSPEVRPSPLIPPGVLTFTVHADR
jgi:FkbM family methyltransferase